MKREVYEAVRERISGCQALAHGRMADENGGFCVLGHIAMAYASPLGLQAGWAKGDLLEIVGPPHIVAGGLLLPVQIRYWAGTTASHEAELRTANDANDLSDEERKSLVLSTLDQLQEKDAQTR